MPQRLPRGAEAVFGQRVSHGYIVTLSDVKAGESRAGVEMNVRAVLLGIVCVVAIGCATKPQASAPATHPSVTPASPTVVPTTTVESAPIPSPSPTPTPTPSPTLPANPVLVDTTTTDTRVTYEIAVAPVSAPLDESTATALANKIGALVGFGKPIFVYSSPADGTWAANWSQTLDGYPVEGGVLLQINADGTVAQFFKEIGPRAPKPAKLISRAQAESAVGSKSNAAKIEWDKAGTDSYHLVWRLDYGVNDPAADKYPCVLSVDAGTGVLLQTACVS